MHNNSEGKLPPYEGIRMPGMDSYFVCPHTGCSAATPLAGRQASAQVYVNTRDVRGIKRAGREELRIQLICEDAHEWTLVIGFHEGMNFIQCLPEILPDHRLEELGIFKFSNFVNFKRGVSHVSRD